MACLSLAGNRVDALSPAREGTTVEYAVRAMVPQPDGAADSLEYVAPPFTYDVLKVFGGERGRAVAFRHSTEGERRPSRVRVPAGHVQGQTLKVELPDTVKAFYGRSEQEGEGAHQHLNS